MNRIEQALAAGGVVGGVFGGGRGFMRFLPEEFQQLRKGVLQQLGEDGEEE
jgi:hypothetical protein